MSSPNAPQSHSLQIRFVDRPEISETFADSTRTFTFDGHTMRIEFCTIRMDEPKPPNSPTGATVSGVPFGAHSPMRPSIYLTS